jgi:hypothetical protein
MTPRFTIHIITAAAQSHLLARQNRDHAEPFVSDFRSSMRKRGRLIDFTITPKGVSTITVRQTLQGHLAICELLDQLQALVDR